MWEEQAWYGEGQIFTYKHDNFMVSARYIQVERLRRQLKLQDWSLRDSLML